MNIKKINNLKGLEIEKNELNVFFYKNIALVGGVYANKTINNSNGIKTLLNVRAIFQALHKPYYVYNIMANDEKKGRIYKKFFQSQGIHCNVKIINPQGLTYKVL